MKIEHEKIIYNNTNKSNESAQFTNLFIKNLDEEFLSLENQQIILNDLKKELCEVDIEIFSENKNYDFLSNDEINYYD